MLYQTFCPLNDHFRYTLVTLRKLVKGGINNFYIWPYNSFLNVCYFLRTLIDQQDHQMHIRMIGGNGLCHLF